jgi:hypothetical protein
MSSTLIVKSSAKFHSREVRDFKATHYEFDRTSWQAIQQKGSSEVKKM